MPVKFKKGLSFQDIFEFVPNTVQTKLVENFKEGGVYVLEAPMGVGKTEAALYAAYKLMSEGLATGMYFALPTQLTSDIIHHRVDAYLTKILDEEQWGKNTHKKAFLIHSN